MAKKQTLGTAVLKMQKQVLIMLKAYEKWNTEIDETTKQLAKQQLDLEQEKLKKLTDIVSELQS